MASDSSGAVNFRAFSGGIAIKRRSLDVLSQWPEFLTNPINNRAFIDEEYNRAFVFTQFAGYLRRNADIGGFLFWLNQVNSAPLRDVNKQHAMVCSFITSAEYQQRFSPVVTHSNAECQ